jgi:YVTN family beta-propeller protein
MVAAGWMTVSGRRRTEGVPEETCILLQPAGPATQQSSSVRARKIERPQGVIEDTSQEPDNLDAGDPHNGVLVTVPVADFADGLCYNPQNNKVCCSNKNQADVSVIDGATNGVLTRVPVGSSPATLLYNPQTNAVYCANTGTEQSVTVIDGAGNGVRTTVEIGRDPQDLCLDPRWNRVYVAHRYSSSISVLRDSGGGVEEMENGEAGTARTGASIVRGVLNVSLRLTADGSRQGI